MGEGRSVAVLGAGAWGTALAWLLGRQGHQVRLWARSAEQAAAIQAERENRLRLPGTRLPDSVTVTADLTEAVADTEVVVVATPSPYVRSVACGVRGLLGKETVVVSATKGLEPDTGRRMSEVLLEELGTPRHRILALSGPNLSAEIVAGMPAVSVVAGTRSEEVEMCQSLFTGPLFRIYANYDILGVEICGALKNVIAIAAGVCDGLGYGANAKAALLTRGLAEIGRLGTRLGAVRSTFWGVAGVGDLLATCNSPLSRNWQLGYRLGKGEPLSVIRESQSGVAEGVWTARAAQGLGERTGVELPITCALCEVLFAQRPPDAAVDELMTRRRRCEVEDWQ